MLNIGTSEMILVAIVFSIVILISFFVIRTLLILNKKKDK